MSAATIDRYLKPSKAADAISGYSTTKPAPLLRSSIGVRRARDEVEQDPGFLERDTVAHCGPEVAMLQVHAAACREGLVGGLASW